MQAKPLRLVSDRKRSDGDGGGRRQRLGEVLTLQGKVSPVRLSACLEAQRRMDVRLGDLLCAEAGVSRPDILAALQEQWHVGALDLARYPPDATLILQMGLATCLRERLLPWRRIGGATVIAAVYPDAFEARRAELEALFGPVMLALVQEEEVQSSLARLMQPVLTRRAETRVAAPQSCRNWDTRAAARRLAAATLGIGLALWAAPQAVLLAATLLAIALLCLMTALRVAAALASRPHRGTAPPAEDDPGVIPLEAGRPAKLPRVSLLVPILREHGIARQLVSRLDALDYPRALLDICLVAEADDHRTIRTLAAARLPAHMRTIVVPPGRIRTKPRALNYALDFCRGEIVGVYDAEDAPDPAQITEVVRRFETAGPEVACLQGRLGFYNSAQNPLARCFAIEYAVWFSVVLPGLARLGLPVPLGGTTLFFRRAILEDIGAWDAHNVTEDADLGLRLARAGYRTELIVSTTREEANCALWPWVRQRSRWIKGYAMTYATHMQAPRQLWADLGPAGAAAVQILFLGTLLQSVLAPVLWLWWALPLGLPHPLAGLLPGWAVLATCVLLLAAEAVNLTLAALALRRTGQGRLLPWIALMNPYNMLATLAALKALSELLYKPFFWDKTAHGHLSGQAGDAASPG